MAGREAQFDLALERLVNDLESTIAMERALGGKTVGKARSKSKRKDADIVVGGEGLTKIARNVIEVCKRRRMETCTPIVNITNTELSRMARFTDKFNLVPYEHFMHYVPRLVNIVTVRCGNSAPSQFHV